MTAMSGIGQTLLGGSVEASGGLGQLQQLLNEKIQHIVIIDKEIPAEYAENIPLTVPNF